MCIRDSHRVADILNWFQNILREGVGEITDATCSLKLKPETQPVYFAPRPVPYALILRVNAKLDEMEREGLILKTDYCPWGTPLVIALKADVNIRLYGDYKVTVNKALEPNNFSIPRVDELLTKIHGSSCFCILDIKDAYLHNNNMAQCRQQRYYIT